MHRTLRTSILASLMIGALVIASAPVGAATSTATLNAGTLTITAPPANFSYAGTLTGDILNLASSFAVGVNDATGSKAGWNLQGAIGVLTVGSDTIAAANHTIQSVAVSGTTGTAPTNAIGYPLAIPTAAAKISNAGANTGKGKSTETFTTQLAVPADTAAGTYTATFTVTIVSGP